MKLWGCQVCESPLSPWEPDPCGCLGDVPTNNAATMYAIACEITTPLHLRDFVRLASVDFARTLTQPTANAVIAPDFRFCWAGKGLYGLFRHGPLPGPRNLEEATRLILCGSDRPMTLEAIEYTLKSLRYRFSSASLYNAISRSAVIEWQWHDGHFRVRRTADSVDALLEDIAVLPSRRRGEWAAVRDHIELVVDQAIADRDRRLREAANSITVAYDWD